jgi:AmmeMemoRadiSam system protein A
MNREMLLDLAKQSIEDELYNKSSIDSLSLENEYAFLSEPRATFVTLTSEKRLRGCMGSLLPHRKLLDDIIHNAKAAAFQDYRFQPLSKEEFVNIDIEVSLLSLPKVLIYSSLDELKEKIQPGVHGVILRKDHNKATFLPQVWEQLPSFELFFEHLCQKAGLCQDCLKQFPEIETYEVEKIKRQ